MVKGLEMFREHFKGYENRYVLIGGTASTIVMQEAGAEFRSTKDLDIVLFIESLDSAFAARFWEFIEQGKYSFRNKGTGNHVFYRFHSPQKENYPYMLELFSRVPNALLPCKNDSTLTPVPVEEGISSLSAILLNEPYYDFIRQHVSMVGDLPVIGPEILIPLKARAWIDLSGRRASGERIDSKAIRKHRNDIFRLYPLLPGNLSLACPKEVKDDLREFTDRNISGTDTNMRIFGIRNQSLREVISRLKDLYEI